MTQEPEPRMPAASRKPSRSKTLGLLALALSTLALAGACSPTRKLVEPAPVPEPVTKPVDHLVVISVDGLGSSVLRDSPAPHLRSLMARGAYTLCAVTTQTAKTLPSHTSMLTGVSPERHGVGWNDGFRQYPAFPTLMEVARRQRPGLTTALVSGKAKFSTFARPGSLDWSFISEDGGATDEQLAQKAAQLIAEHRPNVLMVHLPGVDRAGHESGWGSAQQQQAIAAADRALARIEDALRDAGLLAGTALLVTADHGGTGKTHSPTDPDSLRIPWIAVGPGIRPGFDLAGAPEVRVRIEDTFATALWLLGLTSDPAIDGRPVVQIREGQPR